MTTAYEAVFVVETSLSDDQYNAVIDKYRGVISNSGGTVNDVDRWDPRRLAYEIKGRREGVYFVVNFTSEPAAKNELDRILRISDDVLRYIIVKQDPKADAAPSKIRAAENERREREWAARNAAQAEAAQAAAATAEATVTDLSAAAPAATDTPEEIAASEQETEPATAEEE